MSRTFSINRGSVESLKVSLRYGAAAQSRSFGHRANAPVSGLSGCGLQRQRNRTLHFSVANGAWSARTVHRAIRPDACRQIGYAISDAYCLVKFIFSATTVLDFSVAQASTIRALCAQCLGCLRSAYPLLQRLTFLFVQRQYWFRASSAHQNSPLSVWTPS